MKNKSKTAKQSKPNKNPQIPLPKRPHSSFKYLRRTFHLNQGNGQSLLKLAIRRFHIKKLIEVDRRGGNRTLLENLQKLHRKFIKKNLFKALTDVNFYSLNDLYWIEDLKNSKKLARFTYTSYRDYKPETILIYLKRINKALEKIDTYGNSFSKSQQLSHVVGKFSKLKTFWRNPRLSENNERVKQEFHHLKRSFHRLPSLQNIDCYLPFSGKVFLRNIIKEGAAYSQVTKLEMSLYCFHNFSELKQSFIHSEQDPTLRKICERASEIFFPFQIFSHLKELNLKAIEYGRAYLPTFFPFVAKGFFKLCSLEKLALNLKCRAPQVEHIFKGMLDLPQLSCFTLLIDFPNTLHWLFFTKFIKKQTNLVSFRFEISELAGEGKLKKESEFLEDLLASLSQKFKLQYLNLKSNYWPLSSLSKGLKRITNTNQIKSFILQGDEGGFSMPPDFQYPFQGLSEFLLKNKETLSELELELPLLKEQEFHEEISKGISQLSQLKDLWLTFSVCSVVDSQTSTISQPLNVIDSAICQDPKKQWNPRIDLMLKPLKNLENLIFDFAEMDQCEPCFRKWMSNSFKILPTVKSLRRFELKVPDGLSEGEAKIINTALEKLKDLNYLNFLDFSGARDFNFQKVVDQVRAIRNQQNLRLNLSF